MQIRDGPVTGPAGPAAAEAVPGKPAAVRREALAPRSLNTQPYVSPPAAARSLAGAFR
jgi:hypothetical protein